MINFKSYEPSYDFDSMHDQVDKDYINEMDEEFEDEERDELEEILLTKYFGI